MNKFEEIMKKSGWFYKEGPEQDVVISSRVRFARNLINYPFPHILSPEQDKEVKNVIIDAFSNLSDEYNFTILCLDDVNSIEKNVLLERNIVTKEYFKQKNGVVILSEDGDINGMMNEEDHLRISCIKAGHSLKEAFEQVDTLDSALEKYIAYASSVEWGYLTSSLNDLGTGVRFSVLIHLPALELTSLLSETLNLIHEKGFSIKAFRGSGNHSLGDIYQISNRLSIGYNEVDILEHMNKLLKPLILLERKTREALYKKKKREIEDKILRVLGVLKYCRMISINEAIEHLSLIRLGICLGFVTDIPLTKITTLFFLSQKSHVQQILERMNFDVTLCDTMRAEIIRDIL
jgi:protein arginine kinase